MSAYAVEAARRYYDAGLWRDETFYGLAAAHAGTRPERPALRDGRARTLVFQR